jgi:hypothetical protein
MLSGNRWFAPLRFHPWPKLAASKRRNGAPPRRDLAVDQLNRTDPSPRTLLMTVPGFVWDERACAISRQVAQKPNFGTEQAAKSFNRQGTVRGVILSVPDRVVLQ